MSDYKEIITSIAERPYCHFILAFLLLVCPVFFYLIPTGDSFASHLVPSLTSATRFFAFLLTGTGVFMLYQKSVVKKYQETSDYYIENFRNIQGTSWENVKKLVVFYFRKHYFVVKFGEDRYSFVAESENFVVKIDCKHWDKESVSFQDVISIHEANNNENYKMLYIVSKGKFSSRASTFIYDKNIRLINGYQLVEWMKTINEE